jgi:hypothetical protein
MKRTVKRRYSTKSKSRRSTKRGGVIVRTLSTAYPKSLGAIYGKLEQTIGQKAEKELEQKMEREFKVQINERLNDVPEALIKNTSVYKDYEAKVISAYNDSMVKAGQLIGEQVKLTQQKIKEIVEDALNKELFSTEVKRFSGPLESHIEEIPESTYA